MKQEAEKIYNIEHADNVVIDMCELNKAIDRIPELIETTIAMVLSRYSPDDTICHYNAPVSLKSKPESSYNAGDIVLSHWQIDGCIGKGSIGSVYEAHHTGHGALYRSAIKVINSSLLSSPIGEDASHTNFNASYMVEQELDNLVELKGTGYIVDYEDHEKVTYSDGSWGIIIRMELLEPLRGKMLSENEVVRLGIDICKALEFCTASNIIHCDVKPSNIYTTKWGGYKLGEFSASKKIRDWQEHDRIGTLKYMAPEVFSGKPFSSNIDTYSLGLVMYEMLGGNRTKSMADREEALSRRFSGEPLAPLPNAGRKLQSIILKACAYDPKDRYSSPTEMLNELSKVKRQSRWG